MRINSDDAIKKGIADKLAANNNWLALIRKRKKDRDADAARPDAAGDEAA